MMYRFLLLSACCFAFSASIGLAQGPATGNGARLPAVPLAAQPTPLAAGPQGGSVKRVAGHDLETIVSIEGLRLLAYDQAGQPVSLRQARGVVLLRVEGNAKRYRYDLLPDGKTGLVAAVNLSAVAGRQLEIEVRLAGFPGSEDQVLTFHEVATVPASLQQRIAEAVARQKICPVSGKPLGSMGDPVAVMLNGQPLYLCCAGCKNAVKAEPKKYSQGRPAITVAAATQADAAAIARQGVCPVMDEKLGGMGTPVKVTIGDKPLFLCCKGCIKKVKAEPARYLAMVSGDADSTAKVPAGKEQVREGVFKVTAVDAPFIAAQKKCPVMDEPLNAMGGPYKVDAAGRAIYICCPGCAKRITADPQKYLAILKTQNVQAPVIR